MLRSALFIAKKDVRFMLRRRETLLWTFVMPIIFFYFIGTATSGFGTRSEKPDPVAVRVPSNAGFLSDEVLRRLTEQNYEIVRPATDEAFAESDRRLTIEPAFTDSILSGKRGTVEFRQAGEGPSADYDQVRVGRAVYSVLADLVVSAESGETPTPESFERIRNMPRALQLHVAPAGKRREVPTGFEQTIPGTMVMFTLLVLLTSGAVQIVVERKEGLLRRLASAPISRGSILFGKWGGRMALGLVQVGFAMLVGTVLFHMKWGTALPMIIVVLIAYAALNASLGLLLGSVARNQGQAVGIGVLSANVMAALGGCWWPIEITPRWMQTFSLALPTGWAMDAMHKLISFEAGAASAIPHVLVMIAAALLFGWLAARAFRFQ